jgi:hypothetical protein
MSVWEYITMNTATKKIRMRRKNINNNFKHGIQCKCCSKIISLNMVILITSLFFSVSSKFHQRKAKKKKLLLTKHFLLFLKATGSGFWILDTTNCA